MANSCRRLVAVWLFGVQWAGGQAGPSDTPLPSLTVSGAGAGVLGGAAGQYWESPGGCWLVQALAPGFRVSTGPSVARRQEQILGVLGERNRK